MLLSNRYELQEEIERGGMSTVYRGWDTRTNKDVAIKMLREVYSTGSEHITRFQQVAEISFCNAWKKCLRNVLAVQSWHKN